MDVLCSDLVAGELPNRGLAIDVCGPSFFVPKMLNCEGCSFTGLMPPNEKGVLEPNAGAAAPDPKVVPDPKAKADGLAWSPAVWFEIANDDPKLGIAAAPDPKEEVPAPDPKLDFFVGDSFSTSSSESWSLLLLASLALSSSSC